MKKIFDPELYARVQEKKKLASYTHTHPSHYADGRKYEAIDVIADWDLNFDLGNAVKYIARAGRKGSAIEDLEKAVYYINHEIEVLKNEQ